MVLYPQTPGVIAGGVPASSLNNTANTIRTEVVGNASVGVGGTSSVDNTRANAISTQGVSNNAPAVAAAAASAALAAVASMAQRPLQQQHIGQCAALPTPQHPTTTIPPPTFSYTFSTAPQQHVAATHQVAPAVPSAAVAPGPLGQQPPTTETPSLFKNMKLRRGKWTKEEEEYAAYLIQEFEKGTINGCENGCTLRAFLSKRLHCAPMRISKKYAGKSIGKHVFLSRKPGSGIQGLTSTTDTKEAADNSARLNQLEMAFYKSLFQDRDPNPGSIPLSSPYALASYLPPAGAPSVTSRTLFNQQPLQYSTAPFGTYPMTLTPSAPHAIAPAPTAVTAPAARTLAPGSSVVSVPAPAPVIPGWPTTVPAPAPSQSVQAPPATSSTLDETTKKLHQSYLDALNQVHMNFAPAPPPSHAVQQGPQPVQQSTTGGEQTAVLPQGKVAAPLQVGTQIATGMGTNAMQYHAAPTSQSPAPAGIASAPANPVTQGSGVGAVNSLVVKTGAPMMGALVPHGGPQDIPDILSGFDRVAASSKVHGEALQNAVHSAPPPSLFNESLLSNQYSPPFTSRSFDDFHQLLGKDLHEQPLSIGEVKTGSEPALAANQVIQASVQRPGNQGNTGKPEISFDASRMSSSLTADAYAIFAQESALAVSQHSAYCRTESIPSDSGTLPDVSEPVRVQASGVLPNRSSAVVVNPDGSRTVHKQSSNVTPPSSVVNAANLRAHAKAAEQTARKELNAASAATKSKNQGVPQSYVMRRNPHIISASERSNSDMGTEESESALGSSRGSGSDSNDPSDNTSNDSDSNSDDGPAFKKRKTCRQEAGETDGIPLSNEVVSPVSLDRGSQPGN